MSGGVGTTGALSLVGIRPEVLGENHTLMLVLLSASVIGSAGAPSWARSALPCSAPTALGLSGMPAATVSALSLSQ